jgi:thioredoxin
MEKINTQEFKERIFDFSKSKKFQLIGDKPVIIDFFADWCGPCKMIAPILEELSKEYEGKIEIFKVDVDDEHEISAAFGIRSIPSVLFAPLNEDPQMMAGALPKKMFVKAINEVLKIN